MRTKVQRTRGIVLLVLDATADVGVGHATRCQALAEELLSRGLGVAQVGRMEVPWLEQAYNSCGIELLGPVPPYAAAADSRVVAVVIDSYSLPVSTSRSVANLGRPVLAIVDGATRGQAADLYLDQNLDASPELLGVDPARALCGAPYALLRSVVLGLRRGPWQPDPEAANDRVTVLFGGTDPKHGAAVVARLLADSHLAMDVTIMAASPEHAHELAAVQWSPGQGANVVPPDADVVRSVATADLVVSAGGSSLYEIMALGRPSAVCLVAENQAGHYDGVVERGLALGLGSIEDIRSEPHIGARLLESLVANPDRRAAMATAGYATVDGRGPIRVADRLLDLVHRTE